MEKISRRIAVRGIVANDDKLLLVRLKHTKIVPESIRLTWCLPGGGLWENELILDGLTREMIEETGVKPVIGNLLYINQFNKDDRNHIEFFFHIINSQDYLNINLAKTTHGINELEEIDFKDPKTIHIMPKFLKNENIFEHIAMNKPTKVFTL